MAAILTPVLANPADRSGHDAVSLVSGLAALVVGAGMLLGSMVQSDAQFHPVVAPLGAAIQTARAPGATGHDAAEASPSLGRRISAVLRPRADHRSTAATTPDRTQADPAAAMARGTRAESAHLATVPTQPDGWDVRWGLIEMAAAQRRDWTRHCPCPVYPVDQPAGDPR